MKRVRGPQRAQLPGLGSVGSGSGFCFSARELGTGRRRYGVADGTTVGGVATAAGGADVGGAAAAGARGATAVPAGCMSSGRGPCALPGPRTTAGGRMAEIGGLGAAAGVCEATGAGTAIGAAGACEGRGAGRS
jgi:hypothetical protein